MFLPLLTHALRRSSRDLLRLMRLALYIVALQLLVSIAYLSMAETKLARAVLTAGNELQRRQEQLAQTSGSRTLFINGVRFTLTSTSSVASVASALDEFEQGCRERGGLDVSAPALSVAAQVLSWSAEAHRLLAGVWRRETADRGFVMCLETGKLSLAELAAKIELFAQSGDLAALGGLHYLYAERQSTKTATLKLTTNGAAQLGEMFPKHGDCPGIDPASVIRPPGSTRLLSTWQEGAAATLTVYRSKEQSLEEIRRHFVSTLELDGWQSNAMNIDPTASEPYVASASHSAIAPSTGSMLTAEQADRQLLIVLRRGESEVYASVATLDARTVRFRGP